MLAVTVHNLVPDGVLVGQILIVEEMLPALCLIEVPDLRLNNMGNHEGRTGIVAYKMTTRQISFDLQREQVPCELLHELRVVGREELHHEAQDGVFRSPDLFQCGLQQIQPNRHFAVVLVLQPKVVPFCQVEMHTDQVK